MIMRVLGAAIGTRRLAAGSQAREQRSAGDEIQQIAHQALPGEEYQSASRPTRDLCRSVMPAKLASHAFRKLRQRRGLRSAERARASLSRHDGSGERPEQALSSVPECPVDRAAGGLCRTLGRVERVLHLLAGVIEALAGFLGRALLVAGGQARQHDAAGGNEQYSAHMILSVWMKCRNDSRRGWLPAGLP
jgi:hypothetical protein